LYDIWGLLVPGVLGFCDMWGLLLPGRLHPRNLGSLPVAKCLVLFGGCRPVLQQPSSAWVFRMDWLGGMHVVSMNAEVVLVAK
jgi:hypothetical protein